MSKTRHISLRKFLAITSSLTLGFQQVAYGLPTGGAVNAGSASISTGTSQVTVQQSSNRAVIDWNNFNVSSGESVRFNQPGSNSIALNRVHDAGASVIDGAVNANGNVWVVNPNGMLFGRNAQVNVGGLLATTSNISNANFMSGHDIFDVPGNPNASIVNQGRITVAESGLAALVAPTVSNHGSITARLGKIQLAAGDQFTVDLYGDGLINLAVSDNVAHQMAANSGTLSADGGIVQMSAAAGVNMMDSVINNSGLLEAKTINGKKGTITLHAAKNDAHKSTVINSGKLDATGLGAGQSGGTISVLGDNITLENTSQIDVSGAAGGGVIKVGGDRHGAAGTPTAKTVTVADGATLKANAVESGNGGNITIWSDDTTRFAGGIEARGGLNGGDGGSVETSGKELLDFTGHIDLLAPKGSAGTLLLDPQNLTIQTSSGSPAASCASGSCAPGGNDSILTVATLQSLLASGNVELNTGSSGAQTGNITFANDLTWSSGYRLMVDAYKDVIINSGVTISNTYSGTFGSTAIPVLLGLRAGCDRNQQRRLDYQQWHNQLLRFYRSSVDVL